MPSQPLPAAKDDAPLSQGWSVHDRTHLEHVFDCPIAGDMAPRRACWEVYFFLPASLRLDADIYPRLAAYRDLQSYTRLHVGEASWQDLVKHASGLAEVGDDERASQELRLFGCAMRATVARCRASLLANRSGPPRSLARPCGEYLDGTRRALAAFRSAVKAAQPKMPPATRDAAERVDEDLSRVVEDACATIALRLEQQGLGKLGGEFTRAAVEEARHRLTHAHPGMRLEEQELRRHALKRFTSSVLWLRHEVSAGGRWALQLMNAVAASLAMLFAVTAAFYHGAQAGGDLRTMWPWACAAALVYAGKDRIKAALQSAFARWVSKRFPDRRWKLWQGSHRRVLATIDERFRFVATVPAAVAEARAQADAFAAAPEGRPERILSYNKSFKLHSQHTRDVDGRFVALRDILRLDVQQWLAHTDDAKKHLFLADPDGSRVYHKKARRRYELVLVSRARLEGAADGPWETYRVVVQRKGIARLERVSPAADTAQAAAAEAAEEAPPRLLRRARGVA